MGGTMWFPDLSGGPAARSRPPASRRGPRGSSGSRGGASFARSISTSGRTSPPSSCLATSLRPIRPRSLSTSWTITSRTSPRAITSSMWPTRPGPTFETWSSPSVPFFSSTNAPNCGRLDDLARVRVADLGLLRHRRDRGDGRVGVRALGRVDEDRAVLPDVDLDVVVGLEATDRLATLADHHADELGVDLDRRDPWRMRSELVARLRQRLEHPPEDELTGPLRLLERVPQDLLRDAGDLDVHLQRRDPVGRSGDLEVHVAEMILGTLDVGEDDVVVALLDETHRDARDGRRDRHAGIHQRERRSADRAHRRRAVRLERLRDEADRVRESPRRRDHRASSARCASAP